MDVTQLPQTNTDNTKLILIFGPPSGHDQGATFSPSLVVLTESTRGRILDLSDQVCSSPHPHKSVLSVGQPFLYLLLPPLHFLPTLTLAARVNLLFLFFENHSSIYFKHSEKLV